MDGKMRLFLSLTLDLTFACALQDEGVSDQLSIGIFHQAPCLFPVPEGWTEGEKNTCGFQIVPERHA